GQEPQENKGGKTGEDEIGRAAGPGEARERRLEDREGDERRHQRHVAVREMDDPEHPEQEAESDRKQRVNAPQCQPVDKLLQNFLGHTPPSAVGRRSYWPWTRAPRPRGDGSLARATMPENAGRGDIESSWDGYR